MGWPGITPDTVHTVPAEWIVFARVRYEALRSEIVEQARGIQRERDERRQKEGRRKPKRAGHLRDASYEPEREPSGGRD